MKKTYQKDLILETFLNTEGHLSVEDVYAQVKKRDKKVGVVTVFRTLRSLKECGIAREVTLGDGLTRFEHCFQHPYHHHIICEKCHKAIEFVCPELERLQDHIINKYGFRTNHHWIQTYGICRDCMESGRVVTAQTYDTEMVFARDALKMALKMEARCLEFYRESAKRNRIPGGKAVFERMIVEEEMHVAELQSRLDNLYRQDKTLENAPVFLHFDARCCPIMKEKADYPWILRPPSMSLLH
ncbi:MAG: transcriptional repressor [Acidobacteriota bacterium]